MFEHADSYANHLRLLTASGLPQDWLISIERLLAEEGIEEAIIRLSCLPCTLPPQIITALTSLTPADRANRLLSLQPKLTGLTQQFHFIGLALHFAQDSSELVTNAYKQISALTTQDSGRDEADAFIAILHWVNFHFGWNEKIQEWNVASRLRILWLHATRLHQAFCEAGAKPKEVQKWFSEHTRDLTRDLTLPDQQITNDVSHPSHISYVGMLTRGLAGLLKDVPQELLEKVGFPIVLLPIFKDVQDQHLDVHSLCEDTTLRANNLDSYLGENSDILFERIVGAEVYAKLFVKGQKQDVAATLLDLQQTPYDALLWTRLALTLGGAPIYSDYRNDLTAILGQLDFPTEFADDPSKGTTVLMLACRHAADVNDVTLSQKLFLQLLQVASLCQIARKKRVKGLGNDEAFAKLGGAIFDAIWHLSTRSQNATQLFCERVEKIFPRWPELAEVCRQPLSKLLLNLPITMRKGVWRVIFSLRSLH